VKRVQILATGLLVAAAVTTSAVSGSTVRAQTAETLTVYSGRSETLMQPLFDRFTQETGIALEVRYGSTAEMAATILEEGDNSPADVYIAQDAGALGALAAEGRLVTLPPDILERVPVQFESAQGQWVGISGRARVLAYNTDLVTAEELPTSILDLTDPKWRGRIGWAPENGSFQSQVTAMRILLGEDATREWLTGVVANEPVVYSGNDAILQGLAAGEISVGLVNHYYLYRARDENPDVPVVNYYFPGGDPGALVNIAGAGIVSTSDQKGLAQRFILYMLGTGAQTYFAEETNEYPLIEGVAIDEDLTPLAEIEAPEIDLSDLSDLQGTLTLLRETGVLP
jgi:iron(III) transport system substrate-binding protein